MVDPEDVPAIQAAIDRAERAIRRRRILSARRRLRYDLAPNASMLALLPSNAHEVARADTAAAGASTNIES